MTPDEEVAYALEAEVELLPWIDEILADIPALGSDPDEIVELLSDLPLPPADRTHLVDLGCGKGAVSVEIARSFGHRVTGFDLFAPFIEAARRLASRAGVAHLCEFRHADLRAALNQSWRAELAVFTALGDVLGPPDETVGRLREAVKPGGYLLIGDAFLADPSSTGSSDYAGYAGHEETLRRLTTHGDRILREVVEPPEQLAAENRRNNALIRSRGRALVSRVPDLAPRVEAFVSRQEEECRILETEMVCATWILQRT